MKTLGGMLGVKPKTIAIFGMYAMKDTTLRSGLQTWDLVGASASVNVGAAKKGVTAGRVIALGVLALAVKKDKTKIYVTIELADGRQVVIEGPADKERQARAFAGTVNQVSRLPIT